MLKAFRGQLLHVNLTNHSISKELLDETIAKDFLGGAGYACRYLYNKLDKDTDPLSPENILMIMTGPLNGTFAPNTGRWVVCAKSPYTGIWGESNCGSWFGAEIKKAGYDGIIISGASTQPVYLEIKDEFVTIKDAKFLWGKGTYYTTQKLKEMFGNDKAMVACIGQAGENLIKYANIVSEERAAGRTGMGAILGSKKLKGIIVKGNNVKLEVFNKEKLKVAINNVRDNVKSAISTKALRLFGTASGLDSFNITGELDVKYFSQTKWDKASEISGVTMAQKMLVKNRYCHSCVIGCGRRVVIKEGEFKTDEIEGPEYETIVSYGSLLLNHDLQSIVYINKKCFDYGIDTISSGGVIGCLTHHFYLGNISLEDIDDIKPEWGNIRIAEKFLEKIVFRKGIGDVLAEGSNFLAKRFNIPQDEIATVNGLEVTYHDLRANYGMAIAYGIGGAHKGPSHNLCDMYYVLMGIPFEEIDAPTVTLDVYSDNEEMAAVCSIIMDYRALYSSIIMCSFCNPLPSQVAELIEHATGLKFGIREIKSYGERILTVKRLFNYKMGVTPNDDKLPQILLRPFSKGGSAGRSPDFEKLKKLFYKYREWDPKTGIPSEEKIKNLNIIL
ncbi:MAG: aldehyde ferredoxin oxidoreductase family protein [Promethearchaeota archaeon]|jgi:aldehyde:ferredoxin oxidoreductase